MIPSSSVEELEDAFNTAKNALETELSFKEEQLQVSSASPRPSPSAFAAFFTRASPCACVLCVCDRATLANS
jgi:hypothetical protein